MKCLAAAFRGAGPEKGCLCVPLRGSAVPGGLSLRSESRALLCRCHRGVAGETYQAKANEKKMCLVYKTVTIFTGNCDCQILRRLDEAQRCWSVACFGREAAWDPCGGQRCGLSPSNGPGGKGSCHASDGVAERRFPGHECGCSRSGVRQSRPSPLGQTRLLDADLVGVIP